LSALRLPIPVLCLAALSAMPLSVQAFQDLPQELPWFVEEAPQPVFPDLLVGVDWVASNLERGDLLILDVRPDALYREGHIPGAFHLDVSKGSSEIEKSLGGPAEAVRDVVIYGGEQDRHALGQVFLGLCGLGWEDVRILDDDYEGWARSGRPVETGPSNPFVAALRSTRGSETFVTREEILAGFGERRHEILDLRDPGGWGPGFTAPPRFSTGHIPRALPFEVESLLPETGWPDVTQARNMVLLLGARASDHVSPNATFILYGEGPEDPDLGLGFLLFRMLGFPVRVFSPGFAGWADGEQNPVIKIVGAEEVMSMLSRDQKPDEAASPLRDVLPKSFILLDLREDWDFDEGHIPGAVSLPEHLFSERFEAILREHWPAVDRAATPLVLYCYGRECIRSRNCAELAIGHGFRKLLWLREGTADWETADGRRLFASRRP
jgi:3-mercaptopyruvate sulfurtransferase SseA